VTAFVDYWIRVRARTMRVATLVPDDRIEWSPGDGVMTFGDLIRHLAVAERWMFVENAMGRPSRYTSHGRELADGRASVLAFAESLHADAVAQLKQLTDVQLDQAIATPAGAPLAAWKWLRAMVEHESHHRGQIYLMLRLAGVATPPLFGLTSEQVRATAT
jgi:uncharacterized damage-inducible protein DinB